jgi:DNA-binding Lrp family transcriptional regulator
MLTKQDTLRPTDFVVVLGLAVIPGAERSTFDGLKRAMALSPSTIFEAIKRLEASGLIRPETREPNKHALNEFVAHGIRYTFPPRFGRPAKGIPTAHSGPLLRTLFDAETPFVWPDIDGHVRGTSLTPLFPNAVKLPGRAPELYDALTLVDAIRAGQARERKIATELFQEMLRRA